MLHKNANDRTECVRNFQVQFVCFSKISDSLAILCELTSAIPSRLTNIFHQMKSDEC